jgi:hypothetical protein
VIAFIVVTVVLAGVPIPASHPAWVSGDGFVFAPLDPIVSSLAQRVELDAQDGAITLERDGRRIVVRPSEDAVRESDGTVYVRLGTVVRELGGSIGFDAVRKVVTIEMPDPLPVTTATPFNPANPSVAPTTVFTPQPRTTPRPTPSGIPQPRRTPVPVIPSYP